MRSPRPATLVTAALSAVLLLAGCSDDGTPTTAASSATSASSAAPSGRFPTYVALGDSYTAAPYVPTTETDDGCLRSDGNYPSLLEARLDHARFVDVSCSGASTTSLVGVQRTREQAVEPQFDALQADTSLVTIGIGGNDLGFFPAITAGCLQLGSSDAAGHPCRDYARAHGKRGGDLLLQKVDQLGGLVTAALKGVRDRSPQATVVLVGYPQPIPARGTCPSLLPLATGDYPYVRRVFAALDRRLAKAAATAQVTYVDVAKASAGHDICAGDQAWINGISTDVDRALALHPFAVEQQAVADLVAQAVGVS